MYMQISFFRYFRYGEWEHFLSEFPLALPATTYNYMMNMYACR